MLQVLQGGDLVVKQLEEHGVVSCLLAEVAVTVCVCEFKTHLYINMYVRKRRHMH